jgi:bd-type cytochrome oxidase subunit I
MNLDLARWQWLLAFFLESTFLGLWIFGWDKLSKRLHLACIWLASIGTVLSAYFILAANSWMQHPAGSIVNDARGRAELTDFGAVLLRTLVPRTGQVLADGRDVATLTGDRVREDIACGHQRHSQTDLRSRAGRNSSSSRGTVCRSAEARSGGSESSGIAARSRPPSSSWADEGPMQSDQGSLDLFW